MDELTLISEKNYNLSIACSYNFFWQKSQRFFIESFAWMYTNLVNMTIFCITVSVASDATGKEKKSIMVSNPFLMLLATFLLPIIRHIGNDKSTQLIYKAWKEHWEKIIETIACIVVFNMFDYEHSDFQSSASFEDCCLKFDIKYERRAKWKIICFDTDKWTST